MSSHLLSGSPKNYHNGIKATENFPCSDPQDQPKSESRLQDLDRGIRKMASSKVISLENTNPNIVQMGFLVRGPVVLRTREIEEELKQGVPKPFKEVIAANIGNCHAMGQVPITFIREVLCIVCYPEIIKKTNFPSDVIEKAKEILGACSGGSVGSYSESLGIEIIRKHVAEYIERRDGQPAVFSNIFCSSGASDAIKNILKLFICQINGKKPGVMIPIPQYPIYSATLGEFDMFQIGYYLNEETKWRVETNELTRAINEARKHCHPRVLVVINPGNPTGNVFTRKNIEEIIKFAHKENLMIFADEVYQDNIYDPESKFYSFKKVLTEMGEPFSSLELASFMSCSKGYMGECGLRGGYAEVINLDPKVRQMLNKCISAMLCPTVLGQVVLDCVVDPPKKGQPSYERWAKEKADVLAKLNERAKLVVDIFNKIEGITCNEIQGAMYAFPQLHFPPKLIEAAKAKGQQPDVFYAFNLLESTGISIVPGSGFGQKPETYHFRTTILPQMDKLILMLQLFEEFHYKFLSQYK